MILVFPWWICREFLVQFLDFLLSCSLLWVALDDQAEDIGTVLEIYSPMVGDCGLLRKAILCSSVLYIFEECINVDWAMSQKFQVQLCSDGYRFQTGIPCAYESLSQPLEMNPVGHEQITEWVMYNTAAKDVGTQMILLNLW